MRVVFVTSTFPQVGGVNTHINAVARALRRRGYEVMVINPLGGGQTMPLLPPLLAKLGSRLLRWEPLYGLTLQLARRRLMRLLRAAAPGRDSAATIWHAHDYSAALAVPASQDVYLTLHGYAAYEAASDGLIIPRGLVYRHLLADEKRAIQRARRVATVDHALARHALALVPDATPPCIITNGIETDRFRAAPEVRARLRAAWGVGREERVVLCPRRLVAKNGVDVLLEAVKILAPAKLPRFRLVYAGDGPMRDVLTRASQAAGLREQILFLGAVPYDEMPGIYQAADLVIVPSRESKGVVEATSLAVLEAMASGVPVVASALGGLLELVRDGQTGHLVPPADAPALAAVLRQWLHDPAPFVAAAVRAQSEVEQHFGIDRVAEDYLGLYGQARAKC